MDFGRIAAQSAKQVIVQKVREAERDRQFDEFKDRIGEIVNGTVKRVEYGNVIVDLGRGEGIIRRDEMIPRENVPLRRPRPRLCLRRAPRTARPADLPVAHPSAVHGEAVHHGSAGNLRRHHPGEVGCPRSGFARQDRRDLERLARSIRSAPASVCAVRASRPSSASLQGEKIDIIPWSQDPATFVVNALQPAEVAKVVLDEDAERIEVVVPDEQLSLAIGRRGQNVRLASQLTGWDIDIMTEAEESERRQKEFNERTNLFMERSTSTKWSARFWPPKALPAVEELAYVDLDEIASIDGFDEDTAQEIQTRAREYLERSKPNGREAQGARRPTSCARSTASPPR
jgi:N utilization substance protein A